MIGPDIHNARIIRSAESKSNTKVQSSHRQIDEGHIDE